MAQANRYYRIDGVARGLVSSYPLHEVKAGTVVRALESAPRGSLDVIDVLTPSNQIKSVCSFQLVNPIKKPAKWGAVRRG